MRSKQVKDSLKGVRVVYKQLEKHYPPKEVVANVYSSTMETDKMGRWQRTVHYNGVRIAAISGMVQGEDGKVLHNRATGTVTTFLVMLHFPTNNSSSTADKVFFTIDEAVAYVSGAFKLFLKHINR